MRTYIRGHESQRSRIISRNDAHVRNSGEHGRNEDAPEHRHAPPVLVPVERLRGRDAQVHKSIGPDERVANVDRLRLVVEEAEEARQDEGLADGEGKEGQPRDDDGADGRAEGADAAEDEAMLARLSSGRCWIDDGN